MKRSVLFVAGIVLAASAVSGSPVGETMALQARIDAAAAGGGEVRVPAGDHRIGGLPLRSGVTLHLEKDAHLVDAMIAGREPRKAREMFVDFYANLVDEKGLVLVGLHWEVGEDANITAFTPVIQKLMDELHPGCSLRYR